MKKRLIVLTGLLLAIVVIVSSIVLAKETFTIYWNSNHDYDRYQEYIKEFEEEHNVTVEKELLLWPDMTKKLQADFYGGTSADLIECPADWIVDFAKNGYMLDLTEKLNNWEHSEDWFDGTWKEVELNSNKYGVKLHHTAFGLFYNKDYFRQAGLDPDQPPKTLLEFVEVVNELGKHLPDTVKAFGFDSDPQYIVPFLITEETPYIINEKGELLIDNDIIKNILVELRKVIKSGNALIPDPASTYQVTRQAFIQEKIAMVITGPWSISNIRKLNPDMDYGVSMIPCPEEAKPMTLTAGTALAIPKSSVHHDLAWEFIKGVTNPKIEIQVTKDVGMLMPRKTWANDPTIKKDPVLNAFADLLPKTSSFFLDASKLGLTRIHWAGDLFSDFYQNLLYSDNTSDETLDVFVKEAKRYIKRELER